MITPAAPWRADYIACRSFKFMNMQQVICHMQTMRFYHSCRTPTVKEVDRVKLNWRGRKHIVLSGQNNDSACHWWFLSSRAAATYIAESNTCHTNKRKIIILWLFTLVFSNFLRRNNNSQYSITPATKHSLSSCHFIIPCVSVLSVE